MNEPPLGKITIDPFTILSEMKWILKLFSPIETHDTDGIPLYLE